MGIAQELHQYFLETEKHREEQRQQPELDVEQEPGGDVNADHDLYHNHHPSVDQWNPRQRSPGYGDSAPKILAIEASLQLSFDKKYDGKQPQVLA